MGLRLASLALYLSLLVALVLVLWPGSTRADGPVSLPPNRNTTPPGGRSATYPFQVRGTQIQVLSGTTSISAGTPVSGALVYRLPATQTLGGFPLGGGTPFVTDENGYLQGRAQINVGDRLLALAPVPLPSPTYTTFYSDTMHLYYTNVADVTELGIETRISNTHSLSVTELGLQQLAVTPEHPLILFDLDVSLEWDASFDPSYRQQLEFDLKKASQYVYDFTDGQVALGQVTVHQNADHWAAAHVDVYATNRLRPYATQGGVVITQTVDPDPALSDVVYDVGQVAMGATWNRYGNPGPSLGEDWPLILAHELGHYLLFLDDTYVGLNDQRLLIAVDNRDPSSGCTYTAMGDVFLPDNTEFIFDEAHWTDRCAATLAEKTLGRNEWDTIKLWYPWLKGPDAVNPGPNTMPFDLTGITWLEPITGTETLVDPTFYLDYHGGEVASSGARAYLLREGAYLVDVGSPIGGQNRLLARGARPGDRLCIFDPARRHYGCEEITIGDNRLSLEPDEDWTPLIQLTPVNSQTLDLRVGGLSEYSDPVKARLYPAQGPGLDEIALGYLDGEYRGTFRLSEPALAGHIQVWVARPALEDDPRPETIVAYSIGGNPASRQGGASRHGGVRLVSPDGQMIFFTGTPIVFQLGHFYTVQTMASLPDLPGGKQVLGQGYNWAATPHSPVITGSISFQYLGVDALTEGLSEADEAGLTVHFWDGDTWAALPTMRDAYYNLVSAPSQGPGVYALLSGATTPVITNVTPSVALTDITTTLTITGANFLKPVQVVLVDATGVSTSTQPLPAHIASSSVITADILPDRLPAGEYQVRVVNGDGTATLAPGTLSVFVPEAEACFYDFFESGANQWKRDGDWAIVTLPGGGQAMTDSPLGNYNSAIPPVIIHATSIKSGEFSLNDCRDPVLTFRHDYVLAQLKLSRDSARVEISTDGGRIWRELETYRGGGIYGPDATKTPNWPGIGLSRFAGGADHSASRQGVESAEWAAADWKTELISLHAYTGTVRLRFSMEVDRQVSDKGWVIDDVLVKPGDSDRR